MWNHQLLNNFNGVHMFGLHEMQPWFEGSFTPFLTRVYSNLQIKNSAANINNVKEKKEIPSFDLESNRWSSSFPRENPHTTKGLRFNSGLGTGIFSRFFGLQRLAVFLISLFLDNNYNDTKKSRKVSPQM